MIQQNPGDLETNLSLLGRLRHLPADQKSWNEFVDRYGALVFRWCRKWGLQTADAEDVTQTVLTDLARQMVSFQYDQQGCFRSWLKTLAYRAWCDFLSKKKRLVGKSILPDVLLLLESQEVIDDFLEQIDRRAQRELVERAMDIVRLQVKPHTWAAFEKTAIENLPGKKVAEQLKMNVGTVYVAKSKVIKQIRIQVSKLSDAIVQDRD